MKTTIFKNCSIFDGHADELKEDHYVVVEGNRIKEVSDVPISLSTAHEIDVAGKTLMPGLIDAHVHVNAFKVDLGSTDETPTTIRAIHSKKFMESALARGFTTLRDAGGANHHIAFAQEQGLIRGPRLFYSGKAISQTGGHGDFRELTKFDTCACSYMGAISTLADGVDEVRKAAREELRLGASQIKIMASGGIASPSDPVWMLQYSDEEILAAVEEALRRRTYVMAHAYTAEAITRCVELGVRSIEHGNLIDDVTAKLLSKHNAFIVPTLSTYRALAEHGDKLGFPKSSIEKLKQVQEQGLASLEICKNNNVKTGFGTDLLGELEIFQCDEFKIRSEVLTPYEILRSATSTNAELMNMGGQIGTISPGAFADIIALNGNPLENMELFSQDGRYVELIMQDGYIYKNNISK